MGGKASKDKGKAGERELCKILENVFGGSFERTAYSGAFVGGQNSHRKERLSESQIRSMKADISPPDEMLRFVIEAKFYSDFPFHALIYAKQIPILDKWLSDLVHDCDEGDFGILCVKINRKGWFMVSKEDSGLKYPNRVSYGEWVVSELHETLAMNIDLILEKTI